MITKIALCLIFLSTGLFAQQATSDSRLAELERRVAALEQALKSSQRSAQAQPERIASEGNSPLQLVSWDYRLVSGRYSDEYEITLNLKNNGQKEIKLIEGSLAFSDLLGASLYRIQVDPDQRIGVGKIVMNKGRYDINQFISQQSRMAQMKKEDVQAVLVIRKLVFTDNTIVEYAQ